MIELFPEGFEEVDRPGGVELAAYTDAAGEERLWAFFGGARGIDVEGGWEEKWRAFHRPVRVGRLWVGPPWEEPPADVLAVVVDPGRAFGTGSHATTRLCLEVLQEVEPQPVLDIGCGSGVLAIAAAMLGHGPVLGVDVESAAIDASRANAVRNGVGAEFRLVAADDPLPDASLAVANISLDAVEALPSRLHARLLLTSGYLVSARPRLGGYRHILRRTIDGWAADLHRRS
jgi:ribosomal protein L11 methyltransferase